MHLYSSEIKVKFHFFPHVKIILIADTACAGNFTLFSKIHTVVISNIKLKVKMRENQPFKKQRDVAKLKENDVALNYVT